MGINFTPKKWPNFYESINNENWNNALQQSTRNFKNDHEKNLNYPRNVFVREQIGNAK